MPPPSLSPGKSRTYLSQQPFSEILSMPSFLKIWQKDQPPAEIEEGSILWSLFELKYNDTIDISANN